MNSPILKIKNLDVKIIEYETDEISCKIFLRRLFNFMTASNKRYVWELLRYVYANNRYPKSDNKISIHNFISQMPINCKMKSIFNSFFNSFLPYEKSFPVHNVLEKEITKWLINTELHSSVVNLTGKRTQCLLNNIQPCHLSDNSNLIHRNLFLFCSEVKRTRQTENFLHLYSTDFEFKTFVSVLDHDYTKSSEGYCQRKSDSRLNETSREQERFFLHGGDIIEGNQLDSDEYNVSSSEDENDSEDLAYQGTISRYFKRRIECESTQNFFDCAKDAIYATEDHKCKVLRKFDNLSYDNSQRDNYKDECVCLFNDSSFCNISASNTSRIFGFENPCFEGDSWVGNCSYIKVVNDNWKINTKDVPDKPRKAKLVSFSPTPIVFRFEPEDDDYTYSSYVMGKMRFRNRILNFEIIMTPFLTPEHRERILLRNGL